MTQEEKQLLIKDLCARLPYSIWGLHRGEDLQLYVIDDSGAYMVLGYDAWFNLKTVPFKPYLRPMSSMTEEEFKEVMEIDRKRIIFSARHLTWHLDGEVIDFFNRKMLDWRGLIPRGLALEAPEGMYNTKTKKI